MKKFDLKSLHKWVFYLVLVLLPVNLGKHFISVEAYVRSRLVDYLIPTLWLQDILILILLSLWLFSGGFNKVTNFKYKHLFTILIFGFLPSLLLAERFGSALYFYITFVLHLFFVIYVFYEVNLKRDLLPIIYIFSFQALFLVSLGIFQWFKQGSVFNNYLFFGEQVYNKSTFNIARTIINGEQKIPIYSIFRHPNILGGYLSIFFVWIFFYLKNFSFEISKKRKLFFFVALIFVFTGIILTFSQFALIALILGVLFYFSIFYFGKSGVLASIFVTLVIFSTSLLLPFSYKVSNTLAESPSIYRRSNLLISAYKMIRVSPVWGVGVNNFTVQIPRYLPVTQVLTFNQPVHNVFILIFSESGLFVLLSVIALLILCFVSLLSQNFGFPTVLFINLLQVVIIGSFDHYFYTIPQTQLLFLLTVGLSLTYTNDNA